MKRAEHSFRDKVLNHQQLNLLLVKSDDVCCGLCAAIQTRRVKRCSRRDFNADLALRVVEIKGAKVADS